MSLWLGVSLLVARVPTQRVLVALGVGWLRLRDPLQGLVNHDVRELAYSSALLPP